MYDTILVPLDGSRRSERILPYVEALALGFGSRLIFLQVLEPEPVFAYEADRRAAEIGRIPAGLQTAASRYLKTLQGEFRGKGVQIQVVVADGPVAARILEIAEREGADLITLATRGQSGLGKVLFGSVAEQLLKKARIPVLLVRSPTDN